MLINNANITGSLTVVGGTVLSGSLTVSGTTLNNLSASYALTASYVASVANLSTFQIASGSVTASVNINSGSFNLVSGSTRLFFISSSGDAILSGSLAISDLTGSGVRYMVADSAGNITAQTASAAIRYSQAYTASAGQTTFTVTNGYTTGLVDVYLNGTKLLDGPEYTDTSGTNIVLATGSFAGDIVEVVTYQPASGVTNNSLRQLTSFTATAGQTTFSASYVPGLLDVYYNGSRLNTIEYTAADGNSITLATGSNAGDLVDVLVYSYQVGAFSGIGGTGVANRIAYWNTTNSITGSSNFTVSSSVLTISGSSTVITGSLLVSGSVVLIGSATPAGTERFGVTRDDGVTDGLHIIADFNKSGNSSAELILGYYASASAVTGPVVYAANSQPLLFGVGGAERMRITTTGNVGIGTTNPISSTNYIFTTTNGTNGSGYVTQVNGTTSLYVYSNANDSRVAEQRALPLIFETSGTERMRITSAGHIGINTPTPVSTSLTGSLTVVKYYAADQASVPSTTAQGYYANQSALFLFGRNSGLSIISSNGEEGAVIFGNASTNAYASITTGTGTSSTGGDMYFKVGSNTERMRLSNTGFLKISNTGAYFTATTTPVHEIKSDANDDTFRIFNSNTSYSSALIQVRGSRNTTASNWYFFQCYNDGSGLNKLLIADSGNVTNTNGSYGAFSDIKLKENIVDTTPKLDDLLKVKIRNYNLIGDETKQIGVIAQELEEVFPGMIEETEDKDGEGNNLGTTTKSVKYSVFVPMLVKALQEANAKITALEEKLERNNII